MIIDKDYAYELAQKKADENDCPICLMRSKITGCYYLDDRAEVYDRNDHRLVEVITPGRL
jgi:hypothetical protein